MEIKYNKIQEIVDNAVFPIIIEETCGQDDDQARTIRSYGCARDIG